MLYLSASFIVLNAASDVLANSDIESLNPTLTSHSLELKPAHSFQLARATFLPDTKDDLGFSGRDTGGGDYGQGDACKDYTLSQCPANGTCTDCPTNSNKKKLTGCKSGYKISGDSCVASTCSAIDSGYKDNIPTDNVCTKITQSGLTCYKDCKTVSCSGYSLNCDSISTGGDVSSFEKCPDCQNAASNCSTPKCKITGCDNNKKVNDAGTACVDKDDTCPNGYYKSCETGIETTVTPEFTEAGTACYQCKAQTPACKVPHCQKCSSSTSSYCTTCEDGYELSSDRKTCREISQCELNGYYNEERAVYYYGDDYECSLTPKLDDGTVCLSDCYTPYACCNGLTALSGKYLPKKDKFSTCSRPSISTTACGVSCMSSGCPNNNTLVTCPRELGVQTCDNLDKDKLGLLTKSSLCLYRYNFVTFSANLDCSGKNVDFSDAYWTGLFPAKVTKDYSNLANSSTKVNRVSLKVKSYSTPSSFSISSIDLTATDKVVLGTGFLADTTITAPKVYIQGNLGMAQSKIIADDIYIAPGASIGVGGSIDVVTYVIPSEVHYSNYTQCSSAPGVYGENYYNSAIGTPERPAAFHLDTTASKNDQTDYGIIQMYGHNLTIYGYNAENTPIFSEAVIWTDSYYSTGMSRNLTISDLGGKAKSNLFYRFHTQDGGNSSSSFLDGKLVYEGSINGKNQQLCQDIKANSYLYTYGSSSNICSLASAADRVECNEADETKATCEMYGYSSNIASDQDCKEVTLSNGKTCYSDCKMTYCHDSWWGTYNNVTFYSCSGSVENTYPDKELLCSEAGAGESPDTVCKKLQDNWRADEDASGGYPDTITPIGTLPYFYNTEMVWTGSVGSWSDPVENTTNKKCVICELVLRNEDGSVYEGD